MTIAERLTTARRALAAIARNRITVVFLCIGALYWMAAVAVPAKLMIEVASSLLVGVALVIVMTYAPSAIRRVRAGDTGGVSQWLVGIVFFFGSTAAASIWSLVWRWTGYPEWMAGSPWLGFIRLSQFIGAAMLVLSPGADNHAIPPQNWRWLIAAVGIGGMIIGATLGSLLIAVEMPR